MSGKCIQGQKHESLFDLKMRRIDRLQRATLWFCALAAVVSALSVAVVLSSATERSEVLPLHAVIRQVDVGDKIHRTVLETEGGSVVVLYDTVKREVGSAIYVGNVDGRWQQVMPPR